MIDLNEMLKTDTNNWTSLTNVVRYLLDLAYDKNFQTIDTTLDLVTSKISTISPMVMVAFLRYTYVFKSDLANWDSLLLATRQELDRRELETEKILQGLQISTDASCH